jgi:hypothetical protein
MREREFFICSLCSLFTRDVTPSRSIPHEANFLGIRIRSLSYIFISLNILYIHLSYKCYKCWKNVINVSMLRRMASTFDAFSVLFVLLKIFNTILYNRYRHFYCIVRSINIRIEIQERNKNIAYVDLNRPLKP